MENLVLGLYEEDSLKEEILKEILNHHGILFDKCNENNINNYSIIITTKQIQSGSKNKVIIINEDLINKFNDAFSGSINLKEEEKISSLISFYEQEVLNQIINSYKELNLPFIRKWYWPNFKKICILIIHDIDNIDFFPGIESKKEFLKYLFSRFFLINYGDNINKILKMENQKKITSTFFFFSKYTFKIQKLMELRNNHKKIIKNVLINNNEIGLHGSINATISEFLMEKEKADLEKIIKYKVNGYRQHLLNYIFKIPHTLNLLSKINFFYDVSISDNDEFGFMKGVCYPYHPIIDKKRMNLIEIPSSYEDWTGFSRKISYNDQIKILNKLFETTKKYNGCITLCIHNLYVNEVKYNDLFKIFNYIINYVNNDHWITTANKCAEWWMKRESTKINVFWNNNTLQLHSDIEFPIEIIYNDKKIYKLIKEGAISF